MSPADLSRPAEPRDALEMAPPPSSGWCTSLSSCGTCQACCLIRCQVRHCCSRTDCCHKQACELVPKCCIGHPAAYLVEALPGGMQDAPHQLLSAACNACKLCLCMSTTLPHTACCKKVKSQLLLRWIGPFRLLKDGQTCLTRRAIPGHGPAAAGLCRPAPGSIQSASIGGRQSCRQQRRHLSAGAAHACHGPQGGCLYSCMLSVQGLEDVHPLQPAALRDHFGIFHGCFALLACHSLGLGSQVCLIQCWPGARP